MASGHQIFAVPNTKGYIHIRLDWWSTFDIAGNYSDVTVTATVVRGLHGYNTNSTSDLSQLFINGQLFESRHHIGGTNHSQNEIARATHRVQHSEDGNKTIEIAFKHDFRLRFSGIWVGMHTFTMSNQRLDSIPRLSDFAVSDSVVLGTTTQITIQPKANIFDHRIRFRWFNKNDMINDYVDKTIRQQVWIPPIEYANDIPNATSAWGTVVVETWVNGVYIGERTKVVTLLVPNNIKPTLNNVVFKEKEANILNLTSGSAYLQLMSVVNVEYKGFSGMYNATITQLYTEVVGHNIIIEGNNKTINKLNATGDVTVKSYVIDSRGRQSNVVTNTLKFIEYYTPVASITARRSGKDNQHITINRNIKIAPIIINEQQKNKMVITYDINPLQEKNSHYSTREFNTIHEILSQDDTITDNFVTNKSFRVTMKVADAFFSTAVSFIVGAEQFPMLVHPAGVSINTAEKKEDINFFVKGHSRFDGEVTYFNNPIQLHALTQANGEAIEAFNTDFNTHEKSGFYWKNQQCANSPINHHGWLEVIANGRDILQRFSITTGRVFTRFMWAGNGRWSAWFEVATRHLPGENGKWAYATCAKGQNFGEFLKSNKVPVGFSIIRDDNTFANCMIIKEEPLWIYGAAFRQGRFDVVTVEGGIFKGYRGWPLP